MRRNKNTESAPAETAEPGHSIDPKVRICHRDTLIASNGLAVDPGPEAVLRLAHKTLTYRLHAARSTPEMSFADSVLLH